MHGAAEAFRRADPEAAPVEIGGLAFDEWRIGREHVGRVVDQNADFDFVGGFKHAAISR
jgi:hypothetical protein